MDRVQRFSTDGQGPRAGREIVTSPELPARFYKNLQGLTRVPRCPGVGGEQVATAVSEDRFFSAEQARRLARRASAGLEIDARSFADLCSVFFDEPEFAGQEDVS